jgi:hypothetical protein
MRFCATCFADGFHSVLHQITGVAKCPIHGRPFQNTCTHCGCLTDALELASVSHPFQCTHCKRALAGVLDPCRWIVTEAKRRAIRRAWRPVSEWLTKLNAIRFSENYYEAPLGQFAQIEPDDVDEAACFHVARRIVPLDFPAQWLSAELRPLQYRGVRGLSDAPAGASDSPIAGRPRDKLRILRSIARHLRRRRLRDHRLCIAAARRSQSLLACRDLSQIEQHTDTCPVAGAYVRWQIYFAREPYVHAIAPRRWDAPAALWRVETPGTDYSCWAHAVLAEFYSCAATAMIFERFAEDLAAHRPTNEGTTYALSRYSSLNFHGEAHWSFALPSEDGNRVERIVILGDGRILDRLEACAIAKCRTVFNATTRWRRLPLGTQEIQSNRCLDEAPTALPSRRTTDSLAPV